MAHINHIWVYGSNMGETTIAVVVSLKPAGEVRINVPIPANFHAALIEMAQHAADLHEAQMKAEILAEPKP